MTASTTSTGPFRDGLPVAFLLPGQGSQYHRMGAGLYGHYEAFTEAVDAVIGVLGADGRAVRADWLSKTPAVPLDHVTRSQILLFTVDYALGVQLLSWGVRPAAMLGHSVGEIAAAVLAGVFSVTDGVQLMWDRIGRLAAAPPGGLLAVAASTDQVGDFLTADVVVGAENAPRQIILSGPVEPLGRVATALRAAGFTTFPVPSSTAFHSPMLAEAAATAVPVIARMAVGQPRTVLYSGYTAAPLTAAQIVDPGYWASHPVAPVRFWPALNALLDGGDHLLVAVGPAHGLAQVARRHPAVLRGYSEVATTLPTGPAGDRADRDALDRLVARLLTTTAR